MRLVGVVRMLLMLGFVVAPAVAFGDDKPATGQPDVIALKVARVYPMSGEPMNDAVILIRAGKIEALGRGLDIPAGAKVIDQKTAVVTPGLIDACCVLDSEVQQSAVSSAYPQTRSSLWTTLGTYAEQKRRTEADENNVDLPGDDKEMPGANPFAADDPFAAGSSALLGSWSEQSSEVTPHRMVLDSVNLLSHDFDRLLRNGVTTVYVTSDSADVIGSRGAILKTGGPAGERIVRRADAVKATMGGDPSRRGASNYLPPTYGPSPTFHTRRPTTRMGVDWVFRKAFYDAQRTQAGLLLHGADTPPAAAIPVLQQILAGQVPLRIQARMQHDIFEAIHLANEFRLKFTLEEATEAYRCLPQLKAAGVPVIFGPLYMVPSGWRRYSGETERPRLNSPKQLADAGIEFALTAQELRDEDGLVRQAMLAARFGLSADAALRAITATPAKLLGLADQVGTLKPGAAADLVVWSSEPLEATSQPVLVIVNGRIVLER